MSSSVSKEPLPAFPHTTGTCLRGVNLGNWLLLEKWMSPQLYPEKRLGDEFTLSAHLGAQAESVLRRHRETWITEEDLAWLVARGINSVRLPFGYWILDPDGPYVASPDLLDWAVERCEHHGISVVLEIHGLPGCQGPQHHTGRSRHFQWPADERHFAHSLDFVEQVAQRYAGRRCVAGLSVVNEPHETIARERLVEYYELANDRVRRHMPADEVAVVIAAYPEGLMNQYHGCLGERPNIWTDVHLYQSFCPPPDLKLFSYLQRAMDRHQRVLKWMERGPCIVGEWSLSWAPELAPVLAQLAPAERDRVVRAYGDIQLASFAHTTGWYFWSYCAQEGFPHWSLRTAVERGWLPEQFTPVADPAANVTEVFERVTEELGDLGQKPLAT